MAEAYDYVVVGGGSAGCVVASELRRRGCGSVLVLEYGPRAEEHPETLRAAGYKDAFVNDRLVWERFTVPQPGCRNRPLFAGSGKGMGGSGSINAMVYTRGARQDYDEWPPGWRWSDVLSDFEALENRLRLNRRDATEFNETCIEAARQVGFRRKEDLNDGDLDGVLGYEWMNFDGEERRSSYAALLCEQLGRDSELDVETGAQANRVLLDRTGRARGVEYRQAGRTVSVSARREVILCAGALETPKLMMLSGIGPTSELSSAGIEAAVDHPEVGRNLHDHPNIQTFFVGRREVDAHHPQLYGFHCSDDSREPMQPDTCFVFYPARSSFREGMMRLLPGMVVPQSLYWRTPLPRALRAGIGVAFRVPPVSQFVRRIYGIVVILGKPHSRGRVGLQSPRADDSPLVDPCYLGDPKDVRALVAGIERARRIAQTEPMQRWGNRELMPGPLVRSEAALESFLRGNVMTTYHYAGTCRMGEDEGSVLDSRLRVRKVPGLRVADASAIPSTPVGAMNAPSMLVGWRAARFAREDGST